MWICPVCLLHSLLDFLGIPNIVQSCTIGFVEFMRINILAFKGLYIGDIFNIKTLLRKGGFLMIKN